MKYSKAVLYSLLLMAMKVTYAQNQEWKNIRKTDELNVHQLNYIFQISIEKIFHTYNLDNCSRVLSISDYLWEMSLEDIYFTFEYEDDHKIPADQSIYKPSEFNGNQNLKQVIPLFNVNYLVETKYQEFNEAISPNSNAKVHVVHIRISDVYFNDHIFRTFIKTRCKLVHLDLYWEDIYMIESILCANGETIIKKIERLSEPTVERSKQKCSNLIYSNEEDCTFLCID